MSGWAKTFVIKDKFVKYKDIPNDLCRRRHKDLQEPVFAINKQILKQLKDIALKYKKTLTQLVLNWTYMQTGITSILVGARNIKQLEENSQAVGWKIDNRDNAVIKHMLDERDPKIAALNS